MDLTIQKGRKQHKRKKRDKHTTYTNKNIIKHSFDFKYYYIK